MFLTLYLSQSFLQVVFSSVLLPCSCFSSLLENSKTEGCGQQDVKGKSLHHILVTVIGYVIRLNVHLTFSRHIAFVIV